MTSSKKILFKILTKTHQINRNAPDSLVDTCSNSKTCYKHETLSYSVARSFLFGKMHLKEDDKGYYVQDVYCEKNYRKRHGVSPMRIPDHNIINCEHTRPQSKFTNTFSRETQKSDLNHLYPTDNKANSMRGNFPFANVHGSEISSRCSKAYLGTPMSPEKRNNRGMSFEPPEDHKGNVARALFYFSLRYKMKISDMQEAHLRNWHQLDPVDEDEKFRNEVINEVQGNRNPFIDIPDLVENISDF